MLKVPFFLIFSLLNTRLISVVIKEVCMSKKADFSHITSLHIVRQKFSYLCQSFGCAMTIRLKQKSTPVSART